MNTVVTNSGAVSGASVASLLRDRLSDSKAALLSWEDLAKGDFEDRGDQRGQIQKVLSRMAGEGWSDDLAVPVSRVCKGIYYVGEGEADAFAVARKAVQVLGKAPDGIGYANASAAHLLELGDAPKVAEVAFPFRPPAQPSGISARWIERAACTGRITGSLVPPEIAVLEVLRDPQLIALEDEEAVEVFAGLFERHQVDGQNLIRASGTEAPVAREGLRNLLAAVGRDNAGIAPTLNRAVRNKAFLGTGGK